MNDLLNKWTVLILGIWFLSTVATVFTRKTDPMHCALWATILIGIGYILFFVK